MSGKGNDAVENKRLDSWKEVAAFFGRDERTVKRWEKNRALPIHRVPGSQRGGVFAYSRELTTWLNSAVTEKEVEESAPGVSSFSEGIPSATVSEQEPLPVPPGTDHSARTPAVRGWKIEGAVCLLIAVAIAALVIHHHHARADSAAPIPATSIAHEKAPPNKQAVDYYLKGRYYWTLRTGESLNRAVDSFTQAIVLDPSYAEAYAGLADTYDLMREYTSMPESEAYPRAIAAATKAVALDDSLSEAHRALAFGLFNWKWEIAPALEQYRRAIALDPKDADAYHWYATSLASIGRYAEALAAIERARALYPSSRSILADRGLILYRAGDQAGGITALNEIEQADPGFLSPPRYLASLYLDRQDYPNFLDQLERAALISKDPQENAVADAAKRGWQTGGKRGMLEAMATVQKQIFEKGGSSGFQLAHTCLLLNRKADTIRYLEAAYSAHDANIFTVPQSSFEIRLRGDPDFERLKRRIQALSDSKN